VLTAPRGRRVPLPLTLVLLAGLALARLDFAGGALVLLIALSIAPPLSRRTLMRNTLIVAAAVTAGA
jgi:hypothetical protein